MNERHTEKGTTLALNVISWIGKNQSYIFTVSLFNFDMIRYLDIGYWSTSWFPSPTLGSLKIRGWFFWGDLLNCIESRYQKVLWYGPLFSWPIRGQRTIYKHKHTLCAVKIWKSSSDPLPRSSKIQLATMFVEELVGHDDRDAISLHMRKRLKTINLGTYYLGQRDFDFLICW